MAARCHCTNIIHVDSVHDKVCETCNVSRGKGGRSPPPLALSR